jgi:hypothetical protein
MFWTGFAIGIGIAGAIVGTAYYFVRRHFLKRWKQMKMDVMPR